MTDDEWRRFFTCASETLGLGSSSPRNSETWCSWTTFDRLILDGLCWASGLPNVEDLDEKNLKDRWWQPFLYQDIAHLIVPCRFYWELVEKGTFQNGEKTQDTTALSQRLMEAGINHRKTELVLEIKLY